MTASDDYYTYYNPDDWTRVEVYTWDDTDEVREHLIYDETMCVEEGESRPHFRHVYVRHVRVGNVERHAVRLVSALCPGAEFDVREAVEMRRLRSRGELATEQSGLIAYAHDAGWAVDPLDPLEVLAEGEIEEETDHAVA